MTSVSPEWLALREPADTAARATDLVEPLRRLFAGRARTVIHDLGCGTGSMGRWLAPRLPGPQHWILEDHDPDLLDRARTGLPRHAADGAPVGGRIRRRDITRLTADDLRDADLVTASALLDMLTADEIERIAAAGTGAGVPALLTISVVGRVELSPADPLDAEVTAAFNAHQRRITGGRKLLGPDAVDVAVEAFRRRGARVTVRPSPWRLGPDQGALIAEWFDGWLGAAREQRPDLPGAAAYGQRRRTQLAAGGLEVVVHHLDLLTLCS